MDCNLIKAKIEEGLLRTPCYIGDANKLDEHVKKVLGLAEGTVDFCYAMKANPFLTKHMDEMLHRIEVCSPGELEICRENNIPAKDIIFSGVNKTYENVVVAMEYGVDVITLESVKHFNLVKKYCEEKGTNVKVLLRLSSGAQFGMTKEELVKIISNREEYPYIDIEGIHYFTGTQKKQVEKAIAEMEVIEALIMELKESFGYDCRLFEYGPGLGVPYFVGEDFEKRYEALEALINYVSEKKLPYRVTFELGRFFVAESMQYLTTIEDIKCTEDTNICLVDGGIHHLNYYGQNMAMRVPRIDVIKMNRSADVEAGDYNTADENWKVCGSLCTFADMLVRKAPLGDVSLGDVLVFNDAGAYSITEAPVLFLSRRMPDIYMFEEGNIRIIRKDKEAYMINV